MSFFFLQMLFLSYLQIKNNGKSLEKHVNFDTFIRGWNTLENCVRSVHGKINTLKIRKRTITNKIM